MDSIMSKTITEAATFYIQHNGLRCPRCKSDNISDNGSLKNDGDAIWQDVMCNDCSLYWADEYKIIGIEVSAEYIDSEGNLVAWAGQEKQDECEVCGEPGWWGDNPCPPGPEERCLCGDCHQTLLDDC